MSPFLTRLQRLLPWSNTRRAWLERLSLGGVLAVVAVLVGFAGQLAPYQQILAWAVLLVIAAVLFRSDWLKLFGPILWYDLVRTSRRIRTYVVRVGYLLVLLAVLGIFYLNAWPWYRAGRMLNSEIARFAEEFCYTFLIAQFVLMVLITPAFTAGAVAEERQKKTIQFLLITDLRNHEIVLGKLGSRMAIVGLLLLAGLPVLGALEFLGGVDPHLVLAGFAGTAVTMASAAGVSILASVVARPSRVAVFLAYGWILTYVVLCWLAWAAPYWFLRQPFNAAAPANPLDAVVDVIEAGNPVAAVGSAFSSYPIEPALLHALGAYALFHGVVALGTTLTASLLLRRAALREPRPPAEKKAAARPSIGASPMVWKELHADRGPAARWFMAILFGLVMAVSLAFLAWGINDRLGWMNRYSGMYSGGADPFWLAIRECLNAWVRVVGTILACLTLLGVAVNAAQGIRIERERETFDTLLTSPLTSEDILYGKWLGAILSVRWLLPWLLFVWGLGVLGGGLQWLAVPPLVLAWCVYAAAMASIGVWFSLVSRTSSRAVVYTMLAVVGLCVGHWLVWPGCGCLSMRGLDWETTRWIFTMQGGLTPPVVLGAYLPFGYEEHVNQDMITPIIVSTLIGFVVWGVFAWLLWQVTNQRFKRSGGRVDTGAVRERIPPRR